MFPNLMMVTTGAYFATYDATPMAPDATRLTLRIRSTADADGPGLIESVRSFLTEDLKICELLQQGVAVSTIAPGTSGPLARGGIAAFHYVLAVACRD